MKIIPNWKKAWRMFSFQADAIPVAGVAAWSVLPEEWRAAVPQDWLLYGAVAFFVLGMIGRLIYQPETR